MLYTQAELRTSVFLALQEQDTSTVSAVYYLVVNMLPQSKLLRPKAYKMYLKVFFTYSLMFVGITTELPVLLLGCQTDFTNNLAVAPCRP